MLYVTDASPDVIKKIKQDLNIKNPEYQKKRAMGLPLWGCSQTIKLYHEADGTLILPRGYVRRLWMIQTFECIDKRLMLPEVNFTSSIQLRDYQEPAIQAIIKVKNGVISMPCGSGKTETGLAIIAALKQPTLWLTHTKDLLNQSLERAKSRLGLKAGEYGVIASGEMTLGTHITFGMVQTMAKRDLSQIVNKFGAIVIDECHHCFISSNAIAQFNSVISQFPAKYRIGLTATAHRADGLIETMFHTIGQIGYRVEQSTLNEAGNVVTPKVEMINTNFVFDNEEPNPNKRFRMMLNDMQNDTLRNNLIIKTMRRNEEQFNLVLGDGLKHLQELKDRLYCNSAFVCGETPKKERERIMEDVRAGKYRYLFATYSLAKEGLDIPHLNRLYLTTPKRDKATIQQAVGRIGRKAEGKTDAIVYDFLDALVPTCKAQASARKKVYKEIGCQIIGGFEISNNMGSFKQIHKSMKANRYDENLFKN
jgi:superfamily II DNA or RNA helicase